MLLPETITAAQLDSTLLCYPALLKALSASNTGNEIELTRYAGVKVKGEGESLEELDWFRFTSAPNRYMKREGDKRDVPLEKDDVIQLVRWELKHGKFRPNLLKLVSGNSPQEVADTSLAAFAIKDNISAIPTMSLLSGVGPATASLLLSVHDPDNVLFFSDEAYQWLVCGGKEQPIKYSLKEYEQLEVRAKKLMERLGVGARDVERTAFIIMRGGAEEVKSETAAEIQALRTTPSQRRKSNEDSTSTERTYTLPTAHKPKSTETISTRKPRTPNPVPKLPESEIPDPKTLAQRASQRLRDANPPPPPERPRTMEEKMEAVLEGLKCKGAALARVVSSLSLRNRGFSSVGGGDECKGVMEKLEEERGVEVSKTPLLGKRDGSSKEQDKGGVWEKGEKATAAKRMRMGRSRINDEGYPERPSIVSFIHYDAVNLSLELEYIGPDLATFSDRDLMSQLPEISQHRIYVDFSSGIEYMHAQNVIHLDIKPQNILLQESGRAVLCDFEMSVRGAEPVLSNGGTPWYIPPEYMFDRRRGREGDVWAFGGTMLFVLGLMPLPQKGWKIAEVTLHKEAHDKMLNWLREVRRAGDAAPKNLSLVRSMLEPNPRKRITAAQLTIKLAAQVSRKSSSSELVANPALLNT
ncbi:hypothetical protein ACLOAV_010302 [Pseudogymnoascus australis]